MPHGFNSDSDAFDELFRRVEFLEGQLKVYADNAKRVQVFVKDQMASARATVQELHDSIATMHADIMASKSPKE